MVERAFGWVQSPPDDRDLKYAAPQPLVNLLPAKVSLKENMPNIENQGQLGSCGPTSMDTIINYDQKMQGMPVVDTSILKTYYDTRVLMGTVNEDSGVENRKMLKALAKGGFCGKQFWDYNIARFREKPPQICYTTEQKLIDIYLAVPQNLDQMRARLAGGRPFLYGFKVYESFTSDNTEMSGIVQMPRQGEKQLGGHDVVIFGYDDNLQYFDFQNSYGQWGVGGCGKMPYAYATNPNLSGDFWCIESLKGGQSPPDPVPPGPAPNPIVKNIVDMIFKQLEIVYKGNVMMLMVIRLIKTQIDRYLEQNSLLADQLIGSSEILNMIVDQIFDAIKLTVTSPIVKTVLEIIRSIVHKLLEQNSESLLITA